MRDRTKLFLAFLLVLAIPPLGSLLAAQLTGVGAGYWKGNLALVSNTTACVKTSSAVGAACALFPDGLGSERRLDVTVVQSSAGATCCFVEELDATIDTSTLAGGMVSDPDGPNGSGPGDCYTFQTAGGIWNARPDRSLLVNLPGAEQKLCHGTITSAGDTLHPPCNAQADCEALGLAAANAACDSTFSQSQREASGVFLLCEMPGAAALIDARKERIATVRE